MVLVARGVDSGTGIDVLVDSGATGDMQVMKLAIAAAGSEVMIPATAADGLLVQVSNASLPSAISSVVPGTGATNLGKAEDAVAASGDVGVFALAVRRDAPTSSAAAGDYHEVQVDALGRLWVTGTQAEDAVAGTGDTGHFALAIRRDTPVADAAAGDYTGLHVNALGYLRVIDVADETQPTNATTTALDSDPVIKGSAGVLYGFQGYCAAAGFVQIHNKATAPTAGNVPVIVIPVAAGAAFSLDLGRRARAMSTGISAGFSSTGPTFTDGGNQMWIDAQYI